MAYLSISHPNGRESRVMLLKETVLLGRSSAADICIDAEWVSGEHARISREDLSYTIEDLGSSNGTWVNYNRLMAPQELQDNDLIFLGRTKMLFRAGAAELEESSVELDILDGDESGIFTKAPPATDLPRVRPVQKASPKDLAERLQGQPKAIPPEALGEPDEREALKHRVSELEKALEASRRESAEVNAELEAQRKRADKEIERLMGELTSWKSRYFEAIEESKRLREEG